jgi:TRAP-type mannitol/chloroaromatic compound transport system permease large subunit
MVIGGLYMGIFTPTEAAGMGAFGAFCFAIPEITLFLPNLMG